MRIIAIPDDTGIAPADSRWHAIDDDTYDGAPDSRSPIGLGATPAEAIADLMEKITGLTVIVRPSAEAVN